MTLGAVSVLAELLVEGAIGVDATEGSGVELGVEAVEVAAGSVVSGAGVSELAGVEVGASACVLAAGGVGREAGGTLGRLELMRAVVLDEVFATLAGSAGVLVTVGLLVLGAGALAAPVSATLGGLVSVVVVSETSAGAGVAGTAPPESARLAVFAACCGTAISLFLTL